MKRWISIVLSLFMLISFCGCGNKNTESLNFTQEVTIVRMPSPPKCKTTDKLSVVNQIIDVLGQIEKTPIETENINGGWSIMIKLNIDGQNFNYTIGGVFTDSDGKQYNVTNLSEIEEKIADIYNKIDAAEVDYP